MPVPFVGHELPQQRLGVCCKPVPSFAWPFSCRGREGVFYFYEQHCGRRAVLMDICGLADHTQLLWRSGVVPGAAQSWGVWMWARGSPHQGWLQGLGQGWPRASMHNCAGCLLHSSGRPCHLRHDVNGIIWNCAWYWSCWEGLGEGRTSRTPWPLCWDA